MNIKKLRAATPAAPLLNTTPLLPSAPCPNAQSPSAGQADPTGALAWCLTQYEKRQGPLPAKGSRNSYLAALGLFCNERGVPLADLEAHALATYTAHDFEEEEIKQTLRGIYTREAASHSSKPYTAPKPFAIKEGNEPSTKLPDTFSASVYDTLPDFLRRCCAPFDGHEKAVMLLGALAVLSGCFPGVGGIYNRRRFGLNLFALILAPAASGKGTLGFARRLVWPYHKRLADASKEARAQYEAELTGYRTKAKGKGGNDASPPIEPPQLMLLLPGNTTAAALQAALADNEGRGIICETEADTLSGALGSDYGNFSDVLRKAFQHEPISLLRKTDRQYIDLENPALSIALTGTPGQLAALMPTAENGLVSRFLFYTFEQVPEFADPSPNAGPPLDPIIDKLGEELLRMIEVVQLPCKPGNYSIEITLNQADWESIRAAGKSGLLEAYAAAGGNGASTLFRLALIAWRIAGILTVVRCFERGEVPAGTLEADSADVTTALAIMETGLAHALSVLATMPTPNAAKGSNYAMKAEEEKKVRELHATGLSFRAIAEQTGIPYRTVGNWIKKGQ